MKKIAIIGANEFQNPLILKAKEMGFETHVFAWKSGDIGERTADYFYPISIVEKEKILEICKCIGISSVVSVGSDLAVHTVNYIARNLGFPCNSEKTDICATNKYEMRRAFLEAGIPVPKFVETYGGFDINFIVGFSFPLIVKPTDRSGSRGVTKVEHKADIFQAINKALECSFNKQAIIEEFIEGNEYSCECISYEGRHYLLAFTKKFTTEAPHFIETGHIQPSDIPDELKPKVEKTIFNALDSLNIEYGASHAEIRISEEGDIRIIEIGARMGGDCIGSDLVMISTGYDFLKMVIDVSCGYEPDFKKISEPKTAEIRFIFSEEDVKELEAIKLNNPGRIYRLGEIKSIGDVPITDSSTRHGYYIMVY